MRCLERCLWSSPWESAKRARGELKNNKKKKIPPANCLAVSSDPQRGNIKQTSRLRATLLHTGGVFVDCFCVIVVFVVVVVVRVMLSRLWWGPSTAACRRCSRLRLTLDMLIIRLPWATTWSVCFLLASEKSDWIWLAWLIRFVSV